MNPIMRDVPINNPEVLELLNSFLWFPNNIKEVEKNVLLTGRNLTGKKSTYKYWTGEHYLKEVKDLGKEHNGFPVSSKMFNLKTDQANWNHNNNDNFVSSVNKIADVYNKANNDLSSYFNARHNALCVLYPPGGWISWHNNANASAYNLIFTWSETGDGFFKYVDGRTKEIVTLKDKPGWQCKAGYFGSYRESEENLVYHSAGTECYRFTVSFIFAGGKHEMSKEFQEMVIEDILMD
jgi:hypothetical protein